jgi:ParB/RepB/Spo0J family partition protein
MKKPIMMMPIAQILIGDRVRQDMGDLDELAATMADPDVGLLEPIGLRPDGRTLAFGERRLRAAQMLGWAEIPVIIIDSDEAAIEFIENTCRKDFTPSELVRGGEAIERIERAQAKSRMVAAHASPGKLPEQDKGDSRDKIAAQLGISGRTFENARAVVEAAEAEPEKYGKLLAVMDRTGKINGVYKQLKVAKQAELIRAEPPPLPGRGPYRVIVADPPWPYRREDPSQRGKTPYPHMSLAEICAVRVQDVAATDCILWLWTTNPFMRHAYAVLDAWGFEDKTILTWVKDRFGNGDWLRGQTEHAILAVRGRPTVTLTNQSTVLHAPWRGHSVKPPEFYDLVESLCPAPLYADLFSRYRHNDKWVCHGNDAPDDLAILPPLLRRGPP